MGRLEPAACVIHADSTQNDRSHNGEFRSGQDPWPNIVVSHLYLTPICVARRHYKRAATW